MSPLHVTHDSFLSLISQQQDSFHQQRDLFPHDSQSWRHLLDLCFPTPCPNTKQYSCGTSLCRGARLPPKQYSHPPCSPHLASLPGAVRANHTPSPATVHWQQPLAFYTRSPMVQNDPNMIAACRSAQAMRTDHGSGNQSEYSVRHGSWQQSLHEACPCDASRYHTTFGSETSASSTSTTTHRPHISLSYAKNGTNSLENHRQMRCSIHLARAGRVFTPGISSGVSRHPEPDLPMLPKHAQQ